MAKFDGPNGNTKNIAVMSHFLRRFVLKIHRLEMYFLNLGDETVSFYRWEVLQN